MKPEELVKNAKLVTDHFGYWPQFHDSEVISLTLTSSVQHTRECVEFDLYVFEMTDEINEAGFFILVKHCVVSFRLSGLGANSMENFNHQNVLDSIEVYKEGDWIVCILHSAYGVDADFEVREVEVLGLTPVDPRRLP